MRLRKGRIVLVTLTDGTVIRGRAAWSWRWHVVRVVDAESLYADALGPAGSGADTYATMMLTNAQRITDALK